MAEEGVPLHPRYDCFQARGVSRFLMGFNVVAMCEMRNACDCGFKTLRFGICARVGSIAMRLFYAFWWICCFLLSVLYCDGLGFDYDYVRGCCANDNSTVYWRKIVKFVRRGFYLIRMNKLCIILELWKKIIVVGWNLYVNFFMFL